jgi:hypothetical protein
MDLRIYSDSEDRLPRSRAATLAAIFDASGIDDHDCARADAAYCAWKRNGKRGKKPKTGFGGILDAMDPDGRAPGSLLEAFEIATKGAKTWRDIGPVLSMLRDVPGLERARFPDDVMLRHALMDAAMRCDGREDDTPDSDDETDDGDTSFDFGANVKPKRMSKADLVAIAPDTLIRAHGDGWSALYRRRELGGWIDEKTGDILASGILAEMASVGFSAPDSAPDSAPVVERPVRKGARRAGVFSTRDRAHAGQCASKAPRRRRMRT